MVRSFFIFAATWLTAASRVVASAALLLLPWAASAVVPGNIVSNANFEFWTTPATVPGWTLTPGAGLMLGTSGGADGPRFIAFGRSLSQDLSVLPEQSYVLDFAIRGPYPLIQAPPFGLTVYWDSVPLQSFTVNTFSPSWNFQSMTLPPSADSHALLEFRDLYGSLVAIDAVSVVPVPEPACCALIGAGSGLMFLFLRRAERKHHNS
jgi:hypothetical protein